MSISAETETEASPSPLQALMRSDEEILTDPEVLREALDFLPERIRLFTEAIHLMDSLPRGEVIILCDWDVLYAYILTDASNPSEPLPLRYFFRNGNFAYAIPLGAFKELTTWLTAELAAEHANASADAQVTDADLFDFLYWILGLKSEGSNSDYRRREIATELGRHKSTVVHIQRLLDQIENRRFISEVARHTEALQERLSKQAVVVQPRWVYPTASSQRQVDRSDRDLRDRSDSANLAVALTRCMEIKRANNPNLPYYLLMTDTGLVSKAAYELRQSSGHMALCARPELVMILDMLGFTKDPKLAHSRATELLGLLNDLRNSLSQQLINAENPDAVEAAAAATPGIRATVGRVKQAAGAAGIQDAAAGLLAPPLAQMEVLTDAIWVGTTSQEMQRGAESSFSRPTGFIQLLDRLGNALKSIESFDYSPRKLHSIATSTFDSFCIDLDRTPSKEPAFQILLNRFWGQNKAIQYWRAEFVHQKREVDLVRFLNAGLPHDSVFPYTDPEPEISIEDPIGGSGCRHGAVIFTATVPFRISSTLIAKKGWGIFRLYDLQLLMRQASLTSPEKRDGVPEIHSIRINTLVCDMIFELLPNSDSIFTTFKLISHFAVPGLLVQAVDLLGTRFVLKDRLLEGVRKVLPKELPTHQVVH